MALYMTRTPEFMKNKGRHAKKQGRIFRDTETGTYI